MIPAWFSRPPVVQWEPSCVVPEDCGAVVRHAAPLDDAARQQLREQWIQRLLSEARR